MNLTPFFHFHLDFSVKAEAKKVKTLAWCKANKNELARTVSRWYYSKADTNEQIKNLLLCGYGQNIGEQIFNQLSEQDCLKIKANILKICQ